MMKNTLALVTALLAACSMTACAVDSGSVENTSETARTAWVVYEHATCNGTTLLREDHYCAPATNKDVDYPGDEYMGRIETVMLEECQIVQGQLDAPPDPPYQTCYASDGTQGVWSCTIQTVWTGKGCI